MSALAAAAETTTLQSQRATILASLIAGSLEGSSEGHCVRINYLARDEARLVCTTLRKVSGEDVNAYVLSSAGTGEDDPLAITADEAIEHRNRKRGTLCLFVPADLIDAAISSLGNSFAEMDGRDLFRDALKKTTTELRTEARDAADLIGAVRNTLKPNDRISHDALLDFAISAEERQAHDELDKLGLELWRVNLIPDAGADFQNRLTANRRSMRTLARPSKLTDSLRDRIMKLKVAEETAGLLERYFAHRQLQDVSSWARELIDADLTFDRWAFPEEIYTDLKSVEIKPFLDAQGGVLATCKLIQPDGPGTPLYAPVGERNAVNVGWTTSPVKPINVSAWFVTIEPTREDEEGGAGYLELPSKETKGTVRTARLSLNLELEETPESSFRVRVVALDETGNEVLNDYEPVAHLSPEFYLTREKAPKPAGAQSRRTAPSLTQGRLSATLTAKGASLELTEPMWSDSKEATYFTVRADARTTLNVGLSPVLLELERRTLQNPTSGGRWRLDVDEVLPVGVDAIEPAPLTQYSSDEWRTFWRSRTAFFDTFLKEAPRNVIEAADWNREQLNAVIDYAGAYTTLLQSVSFGQLHDALTLDTIQVQVDAGGAIESAVVFCPTHPLRAMWLASHAALGRTWEKELFERKPADRQKSLDLDLFHNLSPVNMPAFAPALGDGSIHVFFQNLGFAHGVALRPDVTDPLRRYVDLSRILGWNETACDSHDRSSERLAAHLKRFQEIHPYANPMQIALINPDQGHFLASALGELAAEHPVSDEEDAELSVSPSFHVTGYGLDSRPTSLHGLNAVRTREATTRTSRPTDHLYPALTTTVRSISELIDYRPEETPNAHFAVISDLSRPDVGTRVGSTDEGTPESLTLYGLIARFVGTFSQDGQHVLWQYRIATATNDSEHHPAGQRYSDHLQALQTAMLTATARSVDQDPRTASEPVQEVTLRDDQIKTLETLHANADWVVTVDRFFGVDYYDSPNLPAFKELAEKHLIDHSPEFVEGLGHRMIVTTAWREEVASILRRAMEELGFTSVEQSVRKLLYYLKTISGRLALQALSPSSGGTEAVSLGVVMAWLQAQHRLGGTLLVPVDVHQEVFSPATNRRQLQGQRRCDLVLVTPRSGHIDLTFVEVKSRRSPLGSLDDLVADMGFQMRMTGEAVVDRYFNPDRVDAALQRSYLANVLRFYNARAQRYGLVDENAASDISRYLAQYEEQGATHESRFEGYIVSLNDPGRNPIVQDDLRVSVLTAADFEQIDDIKIGDTVAKSHVTVTPPFTSGTQSQRDATPQLGNQPENLRTKPPSPVLSNLTGDTPASPNNDGDPMSAEDGTRTEQEEGSTSPSSASEISTIHPEPAPNMPIRVVLGDSSAGEVTWKPSVQGSPHLFITGIPGQGKSVTVRRVLRELHQQGVPSLVFDFHGDLAAEFSGTAVRNGPAVVNAAQGLPFSPFEATGDATAIGWNENARMVSEIFGYVCDLGDIQRDKLYTCIRDAYRACGFGSDSLDEPQAYPTLRSVQMRVKREEHLKNIRNLEARCRPILEMDIFRPPTGEKSSFIDRLRGGLIIDLHELASETLQVAAGAFLLRKVYRDMFRWGQAERLRLAIVLDEAHRLAKDITLPKIMKEGRKFGVAVIAASQGLSDFHPDVVGNAGTKIAFRTNHPESRKVGGYFQTRHGIDVPAKLQRLTVAEALVQTPEMENFAQTKMRQPTR